MNILSEANCALMISQTKAGVKPSKHTLFSSTQPNIKPINCYLLVQIIGDNTKSEESK